MKNKDKITLLLKHALDRNTTELLTIVSFEVLENKILLTLFQLSEE